jgi:hypothetical protein
MWPIISVSIDPIIVRIAVRWETNSFKTLDIAATFASPVAESIASTIDWSFESISPIFIMVLCMLAIICWHIAI